MLHRGTIRTFLILCAVLAGMVGIPRADEPQPVVLSPEKYRELTAKIDQLQKQVAAEKPSVPSQCEIVGNMEKVGDGRIAQLKLSYQFRTTQPRQTVALGLKKAFVTDAHWADGTPPLAANEAGLTVAVEKPGDHRLEIAVEAAIQPRGPRSPEVGFDLQLPGCPITILKWAGPEGVKRLRVGRRENPLDVIDSRRQSAAALSPSGAGDAMGPATFIEVAWEESAESGAPKPRAARAAWDVQVRESEIQTAVVLTLSGQAREWRIAAPATANLTLARAGAPAADAALDPPPTITRPEANQPPVWRITFPEPVAIDLAATVTFSQPRTRDPKAKGLLPLGPVGVVDLAGQSGTVKIQGIPTLKVKETPRGDTKRQPGSDDPSEILLRYGNLALNGNGFPSPPAELDIRPATGVVQTQGVHALTLGDAGWRLRSEIAVQPVRAEIDHLDLSLPSNRDLQNVRVTPPGLVEAVDSVRAIDENTRLVTVRLSSPQSKPFAIVVEGLYPVPASQQSATLSLPRPLQTLDREGSVTVATPAGVQASGAVREWDGDKPGTWTSPLEAKAGGNPAAKLARAAGEATLAWKPRRPRIDASTVIDATVKDKSIRFDVEARLAFPEPPPARLRWKSAVPVGPVRAAGGVLEAGNGELSLPVPPPDADRRATVHFTYDFPLPSMGDETASQPFALPVFQLEAEGQAALRIRFWQDSGNPSDKRLSLPPAEAAADVWSVLPPEIVPERDALPYLVIGTDRPFAGPCEAVLAIDERAAAQTILWIDRVFAQSQAPERLQRNRVRYLLRRWLSRQVDFALPADASEVEILLNGKAVNPVPLPYVRAGRRIRFEVPAWRPERTAIVEFRYTRPGRTLGWTDWQLPVPLTRSAVGPCRWQIALPGRSLPLAWGDAEFEEAWSLKSGLPFPGAARGVQELERWFASGEEPTEAAGWHLDEAGITARQNSLEPLQVLLLPRYGSLAVVSALACLLGYLLVQSRYRLGFALAVPAALLAVHLGNPQWLPALLACALPGTAGFLVLGGFLRFRAWRYQLRRNRLAGFQAAGDYLDSGRAKTVTRPLSGVLSTPSPTAGGQA